MAAAARHRGRLAAVAVVAPALLALGVEGGRARTAPGSVAFAPPAGIEGCDLLDVARLVWETKQATIATGATIDTMDRWSGFFREWLNFGHHTAQIITSRRHITPGWLQARLTDARKLERDARAVRGGLGDTCSELERLPGEYQPGVDRLCDCTRLIVQTWDDANVVGRLEIMQELKEEARLYCLADMSVLLSKPDASLRQTTALEAQGIMSRNSRMKFWCTSYAPGATPWHPAPHLRAEQMRTPMPMPPAPVLPAPPPPAHGGWHNGVWMPPRVPRHVTNHYHYWPPPPPPPVPPPRSESSSRPRRRLPTAKRSHAAMSSPAWTPPQDCSAGTVAARLYHLCAGSSGSYYHCTADSAPVLLKKLFEEMVLLGRGIAQGLVVTRKMPRDWAVHYSLQVERISAGLKHVWPAWRTVALEEVGDIDLFSCTMWLATQWGHLCPRRRLAAITASSEPSFRAACVTDFVLGLGRIDKLLHELYNERLKKLRRTLNRDEACIATAGAAAPRAAAAMADVGGGGARDDFAPDLLLFLRQSAPAREDDAVVAPPWAADDMDVDEPEPAEAEAEGHGNATAAAAKAPRTDAPAPAEAAEGAGGDRVKEEKAENASGVEGPQAEANEAKQSAQVQDAPGVARVADAPPQRSEADDADEEASEAAVEAEAGAGPRPDGAVEAAAPPEGGAGDGDAAAAPAEEEADDAAAAASGAAAALGAVAASGTSAGQPSDEERKPASTAAAASPAGQGSEEAQGDAAAEGAAAIAEAEEEMPRKRAAIGADPLGRSGEAGQKPQGAVLFHAGSAERLVYSPVKVPGTAEAPEASAPAGAEVPPPAPAGAEAAKVAEGGGR